MTFKPLPTLAALLLLGSAATWVWWSRPAPAPVALPLIAASVPSKAAPSAPGTVAPAHRMPPADAMTVLAAVADSDASFGAAVLALPNATGLADVLRPENLIRHWVATIDNLPRHRLPVPVIPLKPTIGTFLVSGEDSLIATTVLTPGPPVTVAESNAARYAPLIALMDRLDMQNVGAVYQHFYPLFQQAYQDLGFPNGYFNDRLVEVIDHLLAAPQPAGLIALVRPKVFWEYADPELEALSAGQKLMLRIGTVNSVIVRKKLTEFRALITAPRAPNARAANSSAISN